MENKKNIKMDDISLENMERFDCYKKEMVSWSKEKRQAAKVIYEVKVEDGKSYNTLFAMAEFLVNPIITILLKMLPESSYIYLAVVVIVLTVCLVFQWMNGRHRLYKNIALLKLLEEIVETECREAIEEENKEESDVLS